MSPEELEDKKRVEYYAASVNAWFNTALEHDKSLLALSTGGVGLLITLLTTTGLTSALDVILYIAAILSFMISLATILVVFRRNKIHIEEILTGKGVEEGLLLTRLDSIAIWSFGAGVLFASVIGISTAVHSYLEKEMVMAINDNTQINQSVMFRESFGGVSSLQPTADFTRSFSGAGNLQPQPATGSTSSVTSNTSAPAPSASSGMGSGNSNAHDQ